MWKSLPAEKRKEYQKLILAFASLTDMFTQKSEQDDIVPAPIVNSKFQETIFQKALDAVGEDIGNTSFDASIHLENRNGTDSKYLVGIKTFGIGSGDQKIAQFKTNHNEWSSLIEQMEKNAHSGKHLKSENDIDEINHDLYLELAKKISVIRNDRINSSKENLKGFKLQEDENVECVYHVLMPSKKGSSPQIFVGETEYTPIDIDSIEIIGCTSSKNPTNFSFKDKHHTYKYTSADSQLHMKFNNKDIVIEKWDVIYAEDAYNIFSDIAADIYADHEENYAESHSWSLLNEKGEVELFSGFNSFYGVGSKLIQTERKGKIASIYAEIAETEPMIIADSLNERLTDFLAVKASTDKDRRRKANLRYDIIKDSENLSNYSIRSKIEKLVYRPANEMYIPIPNSKNFHKQFPDFFGKNYAEFKIDDKTGKETSKLAKEKSERQFNLIFEPSGSSIMSFITQDNGKAIESVEKQSYLGEWILRKVFQLKEHEPLTVQRLNEMEINGIRLYKLPDSNDIHLKFIWIDKDNLPDDYWK